MDFHEIINVFSILYKGKQRVGVSLKNIEKPIFVDPTYFYEITDIPINEIEILIGSFLQPIFFNVGDVMSSGKIFKEGKTKLLKSFNIKMSGSIEDMRKKNVSYLKFKKIYNVFHFSRDNKTTVGFDIGQEKAIFVSANKILPLILLELDEIKILKDSYIYPEYFKEGENIYEGMNKNPEKCRKSGVILKKLNIRFSGKIYEMRKKYSESEMEDEGEDYFDNSGDYRYNSNDWLEDVAGTDDPETMNDVYWNLD